jgi:hypothetical protein
VFTTAHHWALSWARWIQSTPSQSIYLRLSFILYSHFRLGLPSGIFLSGLPTKTLDAFLIFAMSHTCHRPVLDHPNNTDKEYRTDKINNCKTKVLCHLTCL